MAREYHLRLNYTAQYLNSDSLSQPHVSREGIYSGGLVEIHSPGAAHHLIKLNEKKIGIAPARFWVLSGTKGVVRYWCCGAVAVALW